MSDINIRAWIEMPSREPVFTFLDRCIDPDAKKRAFVTSTAGAGRTRLLETWANRDNHPGTIVMIELQKMPQIPIFNVACSLLWHQLLVIDAQRDQRVGKPQRPSVEVTESWYSHRQALNLYHHRIIPFLDHYQVIAVVIDNAQLLDAASLPLLLDLERPASFGQRSNLVRAMIFGARMRAQASTADPFGTLVKRIPRLRLPWNERQHLEAVDTTQFFHIWVQALERNLRARFDDTVNKETRKSVILSYAQRTSGSWWGIEDLIRIYHEELGAFGDGEYRRITNEIIRRVEKRLAKIDWTVPDEENKKNQKRQERERKGAG